MIDVFNTHVITTLLTKCFWSTEVGKNKNYEGVVIPELRSYGTLMFWEKDLRYLKHWVWNISYENTPTLDRYQIKSDQTPHVKTTQKSKNPHRVRINNHLDLELSKRKQCPKSVFLQFPFRKWSYPISPMLLELHVSRFATTSTVITGRPRWKRLKTRKGWNWCPRWRDGHEWSGLDGRWRVCSSIEG